MSGESELVIVEEPSSPAKDSPEVKTEFIENTEDDFHVSNPNSLKKLSQKEKEEAQVNEIKNYALQQQILQRNRMQLMDSLNRNTMTPNMHQQLQSTMKLPTSVQNGTQPIGPYVNDVSKKQFQPPPPTSIPESTGDIDIDTESKKSLLETTISSSDLKIIYPYHEPKAAMESIFIDNVMWVKNGKKVRFGFSLSEEKEREIEKKNLEVCMVVFLSIPGHHEKITACAKHAEAANDGDFFKVYRLSEELRADSLISLPLKHNNDDHSMALFFNCVSSCLKGRESKSKELSLNFSFFLREKVEDGHGLQLDLTYRRTIRITTNPGRDAGVLKKRPRSDDYLADSTTFVTGLLSTMPIASQPEVKRALMAIPSGDERFFNRLQRAIERTVKFELNEYQISKETS